VLNVPVPLVENVTVPVGWLPVPIPLESVTVAEHAVADPVATDAGLQLTAVVVDLRLMVNKTVFWLPSWPVSPP
jgi:hypothetical protein